MTTISVEQHARESVCSAMALAIDGHAEDALTVLRIHLRVTMGFEGGVEAALLRLVSTLGDVASDAGVTSDEFRRIGVGLDPWVEEE